MGISRYPRPGYRIAPFSLREILDVPVPKHLIKDEVSQDMRLCDLDESAWDRFIPETCNELAKVVIQKVSSNVPPSSWRLYRCHLPKLPEGTKLGDLELETRTYNCLILQQHIL